MWGHAFARAVAAGSTYTDAYRSTHPNAGDGTAQVGGSRVAAHATIRRLVALYSRGVHNVANDLASEALLQQRELLHHGETERIRLESANSLLDRGGLPRTSHNMVDARRVVEAQLSEGMDLISWENADDGVDAPPSPPPVTVCAPTTDPAVPQRDD